MSVRFRYSGLLSILLLASTAAVAQTAADVSVTKTGPAVAAVDSDVAYTITVQNSGPDPALNVTLTDTIPNGMTFVSATQNTGPAFNCPLPPSGGTGTITCTQASLGAGVSAEFVFVFHIAPAPPPVPGTEFTNTASVSATTPDPDPNDNSSSVTTRTPSADVAISKTGPDQAAAGSNVAYSITVTNLGPDTASSVTFNDPAPAGMTYVSHVQNSGPVYACSESGGTVTCTGTNIAAGAAATFTVVFNIPAETSPGTTFINTAMLASSALDPTEENDTGTAGTSTPPPPQADVTLSKTAPASAGPDTDIVFTITVVNGGPDPASNVTLTDTLPGTLTFVYLGQSPAGVFSCTTPAVGAGGTISCTTATLAPGAPVTFTLTAHVPPETPSGTEFGNTATVTSETQDPAPENNSRTTTVIVSSVDVSVIKSGPPNAIAGSNVTYTLTVANSGPDVATNVVLNDAIPPGTTFVSLTQNNGPTAGCGAPSLGGTGAVTCVWGAFGVQSAQFTLVVNAGRNTTSISNTATASAPDSYDTDPANNSSTATTAVTLQSNPGVTKTGPGTVTAGTDITYTVAVTNSGISDASDVVVTDTLPPNTTFVSLAQTGAPFSCSTPPSGGTGTISCTIASLVSGASTSFTFVFRVAPSATGSISNTANVSTSTVDTDGGNNSSTVISTVVVSADTAVTKSGPATVAAGTNATYTLTVTNNGPSDAANVTLSDAVPAGATFVSFAQNSGPAFTCNALTPGGTGVVTCSLASFPSGGSATFTFVVAVPPAATGSLTNTATVAATTSDPSSTNNEATSVATIGSSADLAVTKSGPAALPSGTNATYLLTVTNNGPSAAATVTLTDSVPAGSTFVSFTQDSGPAFTCNALTPGGTGTITCTLASFAPSAPATFTLVVAVSPTSTGTVDNSAVVTSSTADPIPANNTATVSSGLNPGTTDLSITKTANPGPTGAFSPVTYTIVVTNNGPATAFGTTVTDVLPPGTTFQSATSTQGTCTGTATVVCTIGTLAPSASATITLTILLPGTPGTTVSNTATVSAANVDSNAGNNFATAALAVSAEIPSLSPLGMAMLALALAMAALMAMRMQ